MAAAKPEVAIVDISLKGGSGIELIKDIKNFPSGRCHHRALSMHDESLYAERALRAGARGYIMKARDNQECHRGRIRRGAGRSNLYLSEKLAAWFAEKVCGQGRPAPLVRRLSILSDRELEVFQMLGEGCETRQIAESLHLSMKTVQAYCARIKEKLKLANATELLREAIRWNERRTEN